MTKLISKQEATKYFWEETFPRVFSNMNDYNTVVKMNYQGSEVDRFIAKVFDDVETKSNDEICMNCIFGSIQDIDHENGAMHHKCAQNVVEYIYNDMKCTSETFGCRKFKPSGSYLKRG